MNKHMRATVKKAEKMSLADAKAMIALHDQLSASDRLRWLGEGTPRSEMNLDILEAARQIVAAENDQLEDGECEHQYSEGLSGVICIKCGHFVGNWE